MSEGIRVSVRFGEPLRRAVGQHRISLMLPDPATLADLVAYLVETYADFGRRYAGVDLGHAYPYRVFVNFKQVGTDQMATIRLADNDTVHILIPIAGGSW